MATVVKLTTYTSAGQKRPATTVSADIFGLKETAAKNQLLKQAYELHLANRRASSAQTKTRAQVRGGGRKPWRQKGLGLARAGSIRSPIWRGGGIVFGPTNQVNYRQRINKKAKRLAVRHALSRQRDNIIIISRFTTAAKTADLDRLLTDKLGLKRQILLVDQPVGVDLRRVAANLPEVSLCSARYLSVFRIMNATTIVLTTAAAEALDDWLLDQVEAPTNDIGGQEE